MAEFPLEPSMSKTLIAGVDLGCSEEVLTILSMLSAQNIFYRPKEKQNQADQRKARFHQAEGDHLTLLGVYEAWKRNAFSPPWCFENFLQSRSLKRAQDVRIIVADAVLGVRVPPAEADGNGARWQQELIHLGGADAYQGQEGRGTACTTTVAWRAGRLFKASSQSNAQAWAVVL